MPSVIGYDIDRWMAYFVMRMAKTPSVVMPNLILDKPVFWAAGLFYLLYMFGMAVIVIQPCIEPNSLFKALYTGFVFGLLTSKKFFNILSMFLIL